MIISTTIMSNSLQESKPLYIEYRSLFLFEHVNEQIRHSWKETAENVGLLVSTGIV